MSTEGTKGGVQRPASAVEIAKLPTHTCKWCALEAPAAIVEPLPTSATNAPGRGQCRNTLACKRRQKRLHGQVISE